jgi:hypothetical protein
MADPNPALVAPQGQVQYMPAVNGMGTVPSRTGAASPGFSGAILDLVRSLAQSFAPRGIVQRPQAIQSAVNAPQGLGDELAGRQ